MIGTTDEYADIERANITRAQNRNYGLGEGFLRCSKNSDALPRFLRYQAQAERNYRRATEDLQRLMSMRDRLAVPQTVCQQPPADPDPLLTAHDLSPVRFPLKPPTGEPNVASQPVETKPATTPVANSSEPNGSGPKAAS